MILYIIDRYLSFLILTANHFSPFIIINASDTLFSFIDTFLNSSFPWESGLNRSSVPRTCRKRPLYGTDYRGTDYRMRPYKAGRNSVVKKYKPKFCSSSPVMVTSLFEGNILKRDYIINNQIILNSIEYH